MDTVLVDPFKAVFATLSDALVGVNVVSDICAVTDRDRKVDHARSEKTSDCAVRTRWYGGQSRSDSGLGARIAMDLSEIYRRFYRNAGLLLGSRVVFGLLNLATMTLALRHYGLVDLGMLLLLQSYTRLFAEIVKFNSWQAMLRYGSLLEESNESLKFRNLMGFVITVDLLAASLATACAILLIPYAASWFEWPENVASFAPFFVFAIFFITQGAHTGVLRLYDRVGAVVMQHSLNASVRFVLVGLLILFDADFFFVVLAWFFAFVAGGLWPMAAFMQEVLKRDAMPKFTWAWIRAAREFQGIWRFLFLTNLSSFPTLVVQNGATMMLGGAVGPAAAAVYEVARQFSSAISRPIRMLGPIIFPEFARLTARKEWGKIRAIFKRQIALTFLLASALTVILMIALPLLVDQLFGAEVADHLWLFRLLIIGAMISLLGFAIQPAFLSANKAGTMLALQVIATAVFIGSAFVGYLAWGLDGTGFGLVGYAVTLQTCSLLIGRRLLQKRIRRVRDGESKV
ncbi:MAG: lipopolysaccharide biosynthesis protein [Pseudomonadota bacterium]